MATELPWAKIGYLQSAPSNVSIDLIHDYWNMKKREGVTLGADFWQWEEGKELNPLLKILRDMPLCT
jgi:hypothetical protein